MGEEMASGNESPWIAVLVVAIIIYYLFYCGCIYIIAGKLRARHKWFAFLPIVDIYLILKMSGRERHTGWKTLWFMVLSTIPLAGLVYLAMIYMDIASRLEESSWKGLLAAILPIIGVVFLAWMAFSRKETLVMRQERLRQRQAVPPYGQPAADAQYGQGSPQRSSQWPLVCTLCGEVNPVEFSECRNCGSQLPRR